MSIEIVIASANQNTFEVNQAEEREIIPEMLNVPEISVSFELDLICFIII